jgi:hypothetical protein
MVLLQEATTVATAARIPYESIGVVGLLIIAVGVLWRLITKLADKNERLHEASVTKAEAEAEKSVERAERHAKIIQDNTDALRDSTTATKDLTKAFDGNTKVVELAIAKLEGRGGL